MKIPIALAGCLFLVPAASAAVRVDGSPVGSDRIASSSGLSAELRLSADGTRAMARLSNCREDVRDWPQQCADDLTFAMPDLAVDAPSRTITHDGRVVARWSRFGRFLRMERSYRVGHEVITETDSTGPVPREIRRAKVFVTRVEAQ